MKIIIAAIQVVDVTVHILSDQVEPLRIAANIAVIAWALVSALNLSKKQTRVNLSVFIVLNLVFLLQNGIANDGSPRIFFWGAVASTVLLMGYTIKNSEYSE